MSLATFKVEIAFATDPDVSSPAWEDVTSYVQSAQTSRGRQYELDQVQPGTCTVTLNNSDRRFDPTYTKSPYYPNVVPLRRIRVSATWLGTTYYPFSGYVERWQVAWDANFNTVQVQATDAFQVLSAALLSGSFSQQLTGARIMAVLTAANWAASSPAAGYWALGTGQLGSTTRLSYGIPTTAIDAGTETVQAATIADTDNIDVLAHIQDTAAADRGTFFIAGDGTATFLGRAARYGTTIQATFTDAAGSISSTRVRATIAQPEDDVTRIVNEVKVTATPGGVTQTATDANSRKRYLRRSLSLTPPLVTDAQALNVAGYEVTLHREPKLRFSSLTYKPASDDNAWPFALGLELGKLITVERTPVGSPSETVSRDCFIEKIDHQILPADWTTTYQLSPQDVYDEFFRLGSAQLGIAAGAKLAA